MSDLTCSTCCWPIHKRSSSAPGNVGLDFVALALLSLVLIGCGSSPRFENAATTSTGRDGANALSIPVPSSRSGDATGDLLIAIIGLQANPNVREPDGWRAVSGFGGFNGATCNSDTEGTACQLSIFYRLSDESETSVSFDWGAPRHAAGVVLRYSNVDTNIPIGDSRQQRGSSNNPTAPVVNTTRDGSRVLRIALAEADDAMTFLNGSLILSEEPRTLRINIASFPSGAADAARGCGPPLSGCSATAAAVGLSVSDARRGSAGGSGTASWDLPGGDQWLAASIEIRRSPDHRDLWQRLLEIIDR